MLLTNPISCRKTAFSLLEMLVGVSVVVILVALLFPALKGLTQDAATAKCISHQKNILTALFAYAADNQNSLPDYGQFGGSADTAWWIQLSGYLGGSEENRRYPGISYMRCPAQKDNTRFGTYGLNYGYSTYAPFSYSGAAPDFAGSMKLSRISGGTFLIADCLDPAAGGGDLAIYSPLLAGGWVLTSDKDEDGKNDSSAQIGGKFNHLDPRHNGTAVCGMADGSVKRITSSQWADNEGGMWGRFNQ